MKLTKNSSSTPTTTANNLKILIILIIQQPLVDYTFWRIDHYVAENVGIHFERINFVWIFRSRITTVHFFNCIRICDYFLIFWLHQLCVKCSFRTKCFQKETHVLNGSNVVLQLFVGTAGQFFVFLNYTQEEWIDLQWPEQWRFSKLNLTSHMQLFFFYVKQWTMESNGWMANLPLRRIPKGFLLLANIPIGKRNECYRSLCRWSLNPLSVLKWNNENFD